MNSSRLVQALGAAGLLLGGALLGRHWVAGEPAPKDAQTAASDKYSVELAQLKKELGAQRTETRGQLSALAQSVQGLASPRADTPPSGAEPASPEASAEQVRNLMESAKQREQEHERVVAATFQRAFDAEPSDPSWSSTQRAALLTALEPPGDAPRGLTVVSAECHRVLCRAEVLLDPKAGVEALDTALGGPAFSGGSFFHPGATEGTRLVYAFREGRNDEVMRIFTSTNPARPTAK